jgi:hypothetical protein
VPLWLNRYKNFIESHISLPNKGVGNLLKPLDLQTIMPRTVDLQRIQQTENSRPMLNQQETLREAVKQSQVRQEQVLHNETSSESNRIHEDNDNDERNRERRYRRYGKKKKPAIKEEQPEQANDSERGHNIDIKI